jgi:hypothetical protein
MSEPIFYNQRFAVFYPNEKPVAGCDSILFVACDAGRTELGSECFAQLFGYYTCLVWRNELCKMFIVGDGRNSER